MYELYGYFGTKTRERETQNLLFLMYVCMYVQWSSWIIFNGHILDRKIKSRGQDFLSQIISITTKEVMNQLQEKYVKNLPLFSFM